MFFIFFFPPYSYIYTIVEIDESKFDKRKYYKGHIMDGAWVRGCIEKTEKKKIVLIAVNS